VRAHDAPPASRVRIRCLPLSEALDLMEAQIPVPCDVEERMVARILAYRAAEKRRAPR
jgi:hypothetical protein